MKQVIQNYFKKIEKYLSKTPLEKYEEKRFIKDLEAIHKRLTKKEYQLGGFSMNIFDVPDRTHEFYVYMKFYCDIGKAWQKILEVINVNQFKNVIDLCPGYTPKIELALYYADYTGNLFALDKDPNALNELMNFFSLFKAKFKIIPKQIDAYKKIPIKSHLVIANHIIDDLVMSFYTQKWHIKISDIYEKENTFMDFWKKILSNENKHIDEITPKIVKIFDQITEENGFLLTSQYQSYMERILDLKGTSAFNHKVLKNVIETLCKNGKFKNRQDIVRKALKNYPSHFKTSECFVLQKSKTLKV